MFIVLALETWSTYRPEFASSRNDINERLLRESDWTRAHCAGDAEYNDER
jgi:hypothetical protein